MTTSKQLSNQAANWRRTATALRNMAELTMPGLSTLERKALVNVASIVERLAASNTDAAINMQAQEKKLAQDIEAAKALARPIVMALPMATTAEKLACMLFFSRNHLEKRIIDGHDAHRFLQSYLEDDLRELINTLAINHAYGRATVQAQADELRRQHAALVQNPEINKLATRIDAAIESQQHGARA